MSRGAGILIVCAVMVTACGQPPVQSQAAAAPVSVPPNEQVYVAHERGVSIIRGSGAVVRELPRGVSSPDWSAFYAVEPGDSTVVRVLDPATGAERRAITLPGRYDLGSGYRVAPSGVSRDGSVLALEAPPAAGRSAFAVVDTRSGSVKTLSVTGDMSVDVVADDASSLYLVEHKPDGRYNVRLYDLTVGTLAEKPIVDLKPVELSNAESITKGLMAGVYHTSVAGKLNRWHFSFYFGRTPFVHALNVAARYATCILEVPTGAGPAARGFWTLALAPNGKSLYATNAIQGVITKYDADTLGRSATRELQRVAGAPSATIDPPTAAAISPDGYRLYVVAEAGILVIDTTTLDLKAHLAGDRALRSFALTPDGRRLYALSADGTTVWALDAMSGQPLATLAVPVATSLARVR